MLDNWLSIILIQGGDVIVLTSLIYSALLSSSTPAMEASLIAVTMA